MTMAKPPALVLCAMLLVLPSVHARKTPAGSSMSTPWPQRLPCDDFADLRFNVMVRHDLSGSTNWYSDDTIKEIVWTTDTGRSLRFRGAFGQNSQAKDRIAVDKTFPIHQLSALTVQGYPGKTQTTIWLGCAGATDHGIGWACDQGEVCRTAVAYESQQEPLWSEDGGYIEDKLSAKPGPLGTKDRDKLLVLIRGVASAATTWLAAACRDGRCAPAVEQERSRLERFVHAPSTRFLRAVARTERHNEHYPAGYLVVDSRLEAGGVRVSAEWDLDWKLSVGRLRCDAESCHLLGSIEGAVGDSYRPEFRNFISYKSFVIQGAALAMSQD